jgi:hypothetical protein
MEPSALATASRQRRWLVELQFMWKDGNSGGGGCPALYRVDGGYVVQGLRLDEPAREQLRQLADEEDAVFVPANVLDRLRELA